MKVWSETEPAGGDFTFEPGARYAVLASVSLNYSLAQVQNYVAGKGFQVTYAWETGQPSRATYAIDNWLDNLPPDTSGNHRWVYAEGDYDGTDPWKVGQDPPWPFTMYHVAHVFQAVDAADPVSPSDTPAAPTLPSTTSSTGAATGLSPLGVAAAVFSVGILVGVIWLNVRSPVLSMATELMS